MLTLRDFPALVPPQRSQKSLIISASIKHSIQIECGLKCLNTDGCLTLRYLDNTCDLGGFHISSDGEDSELCYLSESGFTDDLSDKVLATLPVWGPGYEISFEFQLKSGGNTDYYGYQALFAVTDKGSGGPGEGQPGIYHNNGRMTIWFRLNGNNGGVNGAGDTLGLWYMPYQNWGDNAMDWKVEMKKWHHVSVSSIMENGKVNFSLGLV